MELELKRRYHAAGTNGTISTDGKKICESIELPWLNNERGKSCIPEGMYVVRLRKSTKYGEHLEVLNVPERSYILIHPANDAKTELQGSIAPVLKTNGAGKGIFSRKAMAKILDSCRERINHNETILTISS